MRKTTLIIILFLVTLITCSCGSRMNNNTEDKDKVAKETVEKVIDTINNEDEDTLKSMFSKKAINETNNIDENITSLFNFIQGEIESWDDDFGIEINEDFDNGLSFREYMPMIPIFTKDKEYSLFLIWYTIDDESSDNIGLYSIQVIDKNDDNEDFYFEVDNCAGITIWTPENMKLDKE